MTKETRKLYMYIHEALHDNCQVIPYKGKNLKVTLSGSNQPCVKVDDALFVRLKPTSTSVYGRLAKSGHAVTMIMRSGKRWAIIIDNDILDPEA